jgi:hypothetical protein
MFEMNVAMVKWHDGFHDSCEEISREIPPGNVKKIQRKLPQK